MNNTTTENLKSYLDELEKLLKRREQLSDAEENERREVTRLLSYYKIVLAKKVLDL